MVLAFAAELALEELVLEEDELDLELVPEDEEELLWEPLEEWELLSEELWTNQTNYKEHK